MFSMKRMSQKETEATSGCHLGPLEDPNKEPTDVYFYPLVHRH